MAEEIIVTRFTADLTEIEAGVNQYAKTLGVAEKADDDLSKSQQNLSASTGSVALKYEQLRQSTDRNSEAVRRSREEAAKLISENKNLTDSQKQAAAAAGGVTKEYEKLTVTRKRDADAAKKAGDTQLGILQQLKNKIDELNKKKLTLVDPKQIAATNVELNKVQAQFNKLNTTTRGVKGGIAGLFGSIKDGASQAASQIPGVGNLFSLLGNPIALASAAVVGFVSNLSRLDSAKVFIDGLSIAFDGVLNRMTSIKGIGSLITGTGLQEDAIQAAAIATTLDRIEEKQNAINLSNADANVILAKKTQQLRDATLSENDRLTIADEITAVERDRASTEIGLIRDKIKAQIELNEFQLNSLGEVSDANKKQLADLQVELKGAQAESIRLTETTERRRNAIVEQGANDRAQAELKSEAARQKAIAEAARKASVIEAAEKGINATLDELANQRLIQQADVNQKEVLAIEKKYADIEAKTKEAFAKIAKEAPQDEASQADVAQREADAVIKITEARDSELTALRQKQNEAKIAEEDKLAADLLQRRSALAQAELDRLVQTQNAEIQRAAQAGEDLTALAERQATERAGLLKVIQDAALQAKLEEFDAQYAAAEKAGADLIALTETQQAELAAMTQGFRDEDLASYATFLQNKFDADLQAQEAEAAINSARADAVTGFAGLLETVATENTAAAQAALALQKAAAIAQVVINTQTAITGALAGAAANPLIAAGGPAAIAAAAAPTIILAKVNAGIAIATILAQAIKGAYEGEERVGVNEAPQLPGSRDRYLRRVHKNEGIVDADTNMRYLDAINAMRKGRFDEWVKAKYTATITEAPTYEAPQFDAPDIIDYGPIMPIIEMLNYRDEEKVVKYVQGDFGHRMASSVMLAKYYDKNIVEASERTNKALKEQTAILAAIARNGKPTSKRYW